MKRQPPAGTDAFTVLARYDQRTDSFSYSASIARPGQSAQVVAFSESGEAYRLYSDLVTYLEDLGTTDKETTE